MNIFPATASKSNPLLSATCDQHDFYDHHLDLLLPERLIPASKRVLSHRFSTPYLASFCLALLCERARMQIRQCFSKQIAAEEGR